jgi:hypothetical protein
MFQPNNRATNFILTGALDPCMLSDPQSPPNPNLNSTRHSTMVSPSQPKDTTSQTFVLPSSSRTLGYHLRGTSLPHHPHNPLLPRLPHLPPRSSPLRPRPLPAPHNCHRPPGHRPLYLPAQPADPRLAR